MRRDRRSVRKDFTTPEIARFTRVIRKLLGIHDRKAINVLVFFEKAKLLFPKLKLRIVSDADLPDADARAYPDAWLIKIKQGVYEGLRRGDPGARWTFVHELGHVLLRHPGHPFRKRTVKIDDLVEKQAHIFAAEFLAPTDLAGQLSSAAEISGTFKLSNVAATRRFAEMKAANQSKRFGFRTTKIPTSGDIASLEAHAAILCSSISTTLSERTHSDALSIEPYKNNLFCTSIAVAKAAQLLLDAYESTNRHDKINEVKVAASLAVAVLAIKPIREIGSRITNDQELLAYNKICALRAAATYLGIQISDLDKNFRKLDAGSEALFFSSDFLADYLRWLDKAVASSSTILHFKDLPTYGNYNDNNDINWNEVHKLEAIMLVLGLLKGCSS